MFGRFTYLLTWEKIVRLYRLTLDRPPQNTRARPLWTQLCAASYPVTLVGGRGVVLYPQRVRHRLGQHCGKRMRIIRRGPRSDHGGYYEHQIFTCGSCDHTIERSVNTDGTVRERPRIQPEPEATN